MASLTSLKSRIGSLVAAIQSNDENAIEAAILRLSRRKRVFAPLALGVGAFVLLFNGLRLIVTNWRLMLVQILPAMWIWLAMFDLKAHVLHGRSFHVLRGPILIPIGLVIVALTVASFFLNAVFAFAVARPGRPEVRPGYEQALRHRTPIAVSGVIIGAALAFATTVVTRWGHPWFAIVLSVVVGVLMVSYVAIPSRLIGVKATGSRRDKLTTSAVAGALGATVCTPPYVLGRIGLLMLGSKVLLIPGIFVLAVGVTLQASATGAVRAIKLSVKLTGGRREAATPSGSVRATEQLEEQQEDVQDVEEDRRRERNRLVLPRVAEPVEVDHRVETEHAQPDHRPGRIGGRDVDEDQHEAGDDQR
jgi:UPF0716 family protein affecting phage T7 exclusion